MNIEMAKRISIVSILEKLGVKPEKETVSRVKYLSPIRKENSGSFFVYKKKNCWYDFGMAKGGDSIDLVSAYLKHTGADCTVHDCLRWIENMMGQSGVFVPVDVPANENSENALQLITVSPIKNKMLLRLLADRGISLKIARPFLKEVRYKHVPTGREMFALGLPNVEEGYELRSSIFKGSVKKKSISFIRGTNKDQTCLCIFEGVMDFLSAVQRFNTDILLHDCIILNSISMIGFAFGYIQNATYKKIRSFMDNDPAGKETEHKINEFVKTISDVAHVPMSGKYAAYKDVNDWHISTLSMPEPK
jgi:hypothetical protein